jgi:hypothetical protein
VQNDVIKDHHIADVDQIDLQVVTEFTIDESDFPALVVGKSEAFML